MVIVMLRPVGMGEETEEGGFVGVRGEEEEEEGEAAEISKPRIPSSRFQFLQYRNAMKQQKKENHRHSKRIFFLSKSKRKNSFRGGGGGGRRE